MDTCIWMAESLHCASEVITLLIGQTPIQNGFGVKKIKLKLEKKTQGAGSTMFWPEAPGKKLPLRLAASPGWQPRRSSLCSAPRPPSCVSAPPPHLSHQDACDGTEGPPGVNWERPPSSGFVPSAHRPRPLGQTRRLSELPGLGPHCPKWASPRGPGGRHVPEACSRRAFSSSDDAAGGGAASWGRGFCSRSQDSSKRSRWGTRAASGTGGFTQHPWHETQRGRPSCLAVGAVPRVGRF